MKQTPKKVTKSVDLEATELRESEATPQDAMVLKLYEALLLVKTPQEMDLFLKDLCTPQEIKDLAERWHICKMLNEGSLSYREISAATGVSLATIGRVARFLKLEPHRGYQLILKRM